MWGLGKYTALTKQPQKVANNVKKVLGLKHEPDEMEASREVSRSGEAQEKEREKASADAMERRAEEGKQEEQEGGQHTAQEKADLGGIGAPPGVPQNGSAQYFKIADETRDSTTMPRDWRKGDTG